MLKIFIYLMMMKRVNGVKLKEIAHSVVIPLFGEKQQRQVKFIEDVQILMVDVDIKKEVTD
jgi:hypothetical protein